jgi:hypothetical protein
MIIATRNGRNIRPHKLLVPRVQSAVVVLVVKSFKSFTPLPRQQQNQKHTEKYHGEAT